jgi:hypothetical protein
MDDYNDIYSVKIPSRRENCSTIVWVCGDHRFFNGCLSEFLDHELQITGYYLQANPGGLLRLYTSRDALDSFKEFPKYKNCKIKHPG